MKKVLLLTEITQWNCFQLKFSLLFLERDLRLFFALGTNFVCEYKKVYLLLNWTGNKPHSATIFAELTRPYTRV